MNMPALLILMVLALCSAAQPPSAYSRLVRMADSLYHKGSYEQAAFTYTKAFETNGWKGFVADFYKVAKAWAMINNLDSAFRKLDRVITYSNHQDMKDYINFTQEKAFVSLHHDERWMKLIRKANDKFNNPLVRMLDTIYQDDQKHRLMMDSVFNKYGMGSPEGLALIKKIHELDSVNLIKVKTIISTHGWPSKEEVGQQGNATIFLVLQHADSATQVNYLPIMRTAVQEGKADASQLAYLEDRVAIKQGRKQTYGTQVDANSDPGKPFVLPIADPENVDKRRKSVGLPPLSEYLKHWGIDWNVEEHKKKQG